MNKQGLNIKYIIILFLMVFLMPLNVFAKNGITLKTDERILEEGEEIVVTAKASSDKELYALTATLSYDANVFEKIDDRDFIIEDDSVNIIYNTSNHKFGIINKSGEIKKELFKVKLTVKKNPNAGETAIALTNISSSDGNKKTKFEKTSSTVLITKDGEDNEVVPTNKSKEVKDIKEKIITTFSTCPIIFWLIVIIIILAITCFINIISNKKNKNRTIMSLSVAIVGLFLILLSLYITNADKIDVNKDGKKDYEDAEEIIKYIIGIEGQKPEEDDTDEITSSDEGYNVVGYQTTSRRKYNKVKYLKKNPNSYDTNGDGRVDVNDAGHNTVNTTQNTEVTLRKIDDENNYYVKKGNITLKFTAEINPSNITITQVKIGDKYYNVKYNNGVYSVLINDYNKAGVHNFVINAVKLSNGEERGINLNIKKEVLKDIPKATNIKYDPKNGNLEFLIKDDDRALKNAKLTIYEGIVTADDLNGKNLGSGLLDSEDPDQNLDDFEKIKIAYEKDLDIENNNFKINPKLNLGSSYTVVITGSYDLDSNIDNGKNYYENEILKDTPHSITAGTVNIKQVTNLEELYPHKNDDIEFVFDVDFKPEEIKRSITQVMIDNELVDVTYVDENRYKINIEGENNYGIHNHKISAVVLDNNTEVLCDYNIEYDILKDEPEIKDFVYHEQDNKVTFTINDNDKAFNNAKIIITNENEEEVLNEKLDLSQKDFEFTVNLKKGHNYNVKITGEYDLDSDDKNNKNNDTMKFTHELTVYDITLKNANEEKVYYAKKGENVTLKFMPTITPNEKKVSISEVIINKEKYTPTKNTDGTYSVDITANAKAGTTDYNFEKIIIDDEEINTSLTLTVDVLKDEPSITNLLIDQTKDKITFTLNDEDKSLDDKNPGKLIIKDENGTTKKEFSIKTGDNEIDLESLVKELEEGGVYKLDIKVNYDLDSDKDNGLNEEKDKVLVEDHMIKFYKVKLELDSSNNLYVVKNTTVPFNIISKIADEENVKIKSFVMSDNTVIDANENEENYSINLKTPDNFGKKTYKIVKVILSNDIEVEATLNIEVYVLKDKPYINKLNVNSDNTALTYELVDNDSALTEGTITIYDKENKKLKSEPLDSKGKLEFEFQEDETYTVKVIGSYDLDDDKDNELNEEKDKEMTSETFVIGGDYNFILKNASITDALQPGKKPIISFESSNTRKEPIENVYITNDNNESKKYDITNKNDDEYEVLLEDADITPGRHTVTLDSVSMQDLKSFDNDKDYKVGTLTYTVLKEKPKVENLKLKDDKGNKNIDVEFSLIDKHSTCKSLTIALVESNGKIVTTKDITMEEINNSNIKVSLPYTNSTDGRYTVKVLADYELADKYNYTNQEIGEESILTHTTDEIYIKNMYITNDKNQDTNNIYPNKNEKNYQVAVEVYVGDSVKTGKSYSRVSGVTINGVNYPAHQTSGFNSKVYVSIPSTAGVIELKADRVQLASDGYWHIYNDYYSVEEKSLKIEVLKDKPKIENLTIKEDYDNDEVTFKFNVELDETSTDDEDEFFDGTVELDGKTEKIHKGENEVTFRGIEKDKDLDLKFIGSFDLDTDKLNGEDKNTFIDEEFHTVKYGLYNKDKYDSVSIEDGKILSEKGNKYFEKNEKINLEFSTSGELETLVEKVVIDNKEYTLEKTEDGYKVSLDGYHSSGEKEIIITDIVLDNGKKIKLKKPYKFKPEVLKDVIKVNDYKYEDLDDEIKVTFDLKDTDDSIVDNAKVVITDASGKTLYDNIYKKEISFKKQKDVLTYFVKIITDYDRDIDKKEKSDNHYKDAVLLDEVISLEKNSIELKDITDINLYKIDTKDGYDEVSLEDEVKVSDIKNHLNEYFVEVVMENLPTTRAKIKSVLDDDDTLTLVLEYENVTKENSNEKETLRIAFGSIKNGIAKNETHPKDAIRVLLEKLENGEKVKLQQNYDASSISTSDNTYVVNDFNGELDGNGYTIKNLSKPLFNKIIKEGKVKNLKITDVTLDTNGKGALANETYSAEITNVLVDKVTKTQTGNGNNGGLIGLADNTKVESSRATNVLLNLGYYEQQSGTFIGHTQNNTTVNNCYAEGVLSGGWNYTSGFIGNAQRTTITNNYVKVATRSQTSGATAFGDAYNDRNSVYKNNVCFATGTNGNFAGNAKELENNYFFTSNAKENIDGVKNIEEKDINNALFKTKANFSEDVWKIKDVSLDNLPVFKIENTSVLNDTSSDDYKEENETLYYNLTKLMPFYDSKKIIESAKNISDDKLINKKIKHLVPVDKNGNIVTYLTTDDYKKISKLKIIFNDGTTTEYSVLYSNTYDMVVTYKINELGIDYNYNHYIIDSSSQVISNLVNYLKELDYTNNLDILTTNNDSRIYRDFYNETTKNELEEFILKYLSNSNYTNTTNDNDINNYIEKEIKKDKKLEKVLYTYNYFRRFYDLDIDGMKVYDILMFNMQGFDETLTTTKIADLYLQDASGVNFNTNETNKRYREVLSKYTKLDSIPKLLEYLVTNFSNQKPEEWTRKQFKGILEEIKIDNHEDIKYTLWDHFITDTRDEILNQFLPILTLPENSAYIMSMPVQYIIGSQRTYISDPTNPTDVAALKAKMQTYITRYKRYFETAYSILQDKKLFNDMLIYHVDKRHTKTETGATVFNTPYSTTEPFHKNFVEVTGLWAAAAGNNAAAWNPRVEWQVAGIMDSTLAEEGYNDTSHVTFRTWSHESAHVIDAGLFLRNNGRRYDAGGEDYADCFLMQSFGPNDITMNLSMLLQNDKDKVASNITPERINSPEEIKDFYSKVFKTIYIIDYIEAQAFLQLSPEDQSEVAVQVSYPNEGTYINDAANKHNAYKTTRYDEKDAESFKEMNLKTIDDLYDKQIMLYPGIYKNASRGSNSYGGEGINTVHWYQPHNDYGRPDSYALKWLSYEMLGLKGYNDGFVEYASNIHNENGYKTDLMALKKITGYNSFESYKKSRFKEVENNLSKLNSTININEYVRKFYKALKADGEYGKERVKAAIGNGTEEACLGNYWCRASIQSAKSLPNSSEVRREIYYALKNGNDDFLTDNIYMSTKQQNVDFTIPDEEKGEETTTIDNPFVEQNEITKAETKETVKKSTDTNEDKADSDTQESNQTTEDKETPSVPESTPANPDSAIVEEQKSEEKEGLQQDDPTNTTNTVGPEPDSNPDSVQTNAIILPMS